MYYSAIKNCDIANGTGCRVTLFVSGCTNHCKGCFQPETWDFEYGQPFTKDTEDYIMELLRPSYIKGLTLLGGEPMEPLNQVALLPLVRRVKAEMPQKDIWCFTGFTYETLTDRSSHQRSSATDELFSLYDVMVDGRFVEELKDISLWFRGSSNQRIIDMKSTRLKGEIVLLENRDRK